MILRFISILSLVLLIFAGCTKEQNPEQPQEQETSGPPQSDMSSFVDTGITISSHGFLVFSNRYSFDNFAGFVLASTHKTVKEYLDSLGFSSIGNELYDSSYNQLTVLENQLINYVLEENSIVQIEGIVMKPVDNNDFLLTVRLDYFNSNTYDDLVNGTYNSSSMNQFATRGTDTTFGLFEFVDTTPTGYQESTPTSSDVRFWGWNTVDSWTGNCPGAENCTCIFEFQRKTIFWIFTGAEKVVSNRIEGTCV